MYKEVIKEICLYVKGHFESYSYNVQDYKTANDINYGNYDYNSREKKSIQ